MRLMHQNVISSLKTKMGKNYKCGDAASRRLSEVIEWNSATCIMKEKDRYRRMVAVCRVKQQDLNKQHIMEGLVLEYQRYSNDYVEVGNETRNRNVGMCQEEFIKPSVWRKGKRLGTGKSARSRNCLIKRNSSVREKIFRI